MNTILTIDDPLANQEVTIVITLAASQLSRDERPILISLGTTEQLPIIKTGLFGDTLSLIQAAWTAFGLQTQLAAEFTPATETVAEAEVVVTTRTIDDTSAFVPPPAQAAPRPPAKNLSLF